MATQQLTEQHEAIVAALSVVPSEPSSYASLDDTTLLSLSRTVAAEQRLVATTAAVIAGEMARRSAPALGSSGLAQRLGHRTAQELVRVTTGSTKKDATTAVRVGQLLTEPDSPSWLAPVRAALVSRTLSVASAEAIRNGLGEPTDDVPAATLAEAAARLCATAPSVDSDRLYLLAREQRDAIDEAGIVDRERHQREQRSFRLRRLPDGMSQVHWTLDPESAALVGDLYDRATSPRRGGPRFVNPTDTAISEAVLSDTRTTDQLVSDVFLDLLRSGADADSSQLLGTGAPQLRVLITEEAAATRRGHGHIEGQSTPISIETVERLGCSGSVETIVFDSGGSVIDLGREQRLYSRRQRVALAARDGGCMWGDCDRPPSWCEAHHTKFWARDGGSTNLEDGILLCRHHHLLLHNNGWEIIHLDGKYSLIPPVNIDSEQRPIPMRSKSAALRELLGA